MEGRGGEKHGGSMGITRALEQVEQVSFGAGKLSLEQAGKIFELLRKLVIPLQPPSSLRSH